MRKVTCVLLFLICAIFDLAETIEPVDSRSNDNHRSHQPIVVDSAEEEYAVDDEYASEESEISGQPIGRWRSNGEALEPKWRDGDSIPLVPFQTASVSNKSPLKKSPNSEIVADQDTYPSKRHSTLWKSHSEEKTTLISNEYNFNKDKPDRKSNYQGFRSQEIRLSRRRKPPEFEDEAKNPTIVRIPSEFKEPDKRNGGLDERNDYQGFRSREIRLSRRRKPPQFENEEGNYTTVKYPAESDTSETRIVPKLSSNNNEYLERVALRYRETFQNHPNEYELNDEEYQRPRPRKRRPPQNYEFVEAKSSPIPAADRSTPSPIYSTARSQRKYENTRRNNLVRTTFNRTIKTFDSDKPSENSELKSLLKMQLMEGSSLSEILQRKNLTLSDLLQGKVDVINLLKSSNAEDEAEEALSAKVKAIEMMKISSSSSSPVGIPSTTERIPWSPRRVVPATRLEKQIDPFSPFRAASTHAYQKVLPTQSDQGKIRPTEAMKTSKLPVSSEIPIIITTMDSVSLEERDKVKILYDEDEIMEFSDFTLKNSKSSTTPNHSREKEASRIESSMGNSESTLSIEQVLTPTKHPFIVKDKSEENTDKLLDQTRERIQLENKIPHSGHEDEEMRNGEVDSLEIEYQNDDTQDYREKEEAVVKSNDDNSRSKLSSKAPGTLEESSLYNHKRILDPKSDEIYFEMEPDARAEILELLNSDSTGRNLEELLKARNMSIEDLIALRQRGSSQVHLAQAAKSKESNFRIPIAKNIRQNQDPPGELEEEPSDLKVVKPDCSPFPEVKEFIDWIKKKEAEQEPVKDILHIKEFETLPPVWSDQFGYPQFFPPKEESKQTKGDNSGTGTEIKPEIRTGISLESRDESDDFTNILPRFESSQSYENSEGISLYTSSNEVPSSSELSERKNTSLVPVESGHVQEIVADVPSTFNVYRLNGNEENGEEKFSGSRIRPSIIASGVVLGVTLVVFLSIFIICRLRQRQKYTYRNTFSRAVFQTPVLTARKLSNTSSLNTIMVNVVATSTTKRPEKSGCPAAEDDYDVKSDIENDSLDANDSWETIPEFMK